MRGRPLLLLACLLASACTYSFSTGDAAVLPPAVAGTKAQNEEAFAAAKQIIHGLDHGQYAQVWDDSGAMLKSMASKEEFVRVIGALRDHLGAPKPRGAPRIGFTNRIDVKAPVGDYCLMTVDTDFSGTVVNEKVVMQKIDGKWKLVGYFLNSNTKLSSNH